MEAPLETNYKGNELPNVAHHVFPFSPFYIVYLSSYFYLVSLIKSHTLLTTHFPCFFGFNFYFHVYQDTLQAKRLLPSGRSSVAQSALIITENEVDFLLERIFLGLQLYVSIYVFFLVFI